MLVSYAYIFNREESSAKDKSLIYIKKSRGA